MADETTIVEFVETETETRGPGDGVPRYSASFSYAEATPHDSWFEFDISEKMKSALKSGFMSDLTVKVQDGQLRCHSLLLGFASPKLAAMIQNSPHEIVLSGVTKNTFKTLLRIVYIGEADEINTEIEKILDVTKAAHELKIYAAVNYCIRLLKKLLNAKNVCSILNLAYHLDHFELTEDCTKVIRVKTDEVLQSDEFLKSDVATLEHILKLEFVHNVTELDLFQAAVRWSKRHKNPREALGSNLSLIRLGTLTTKDIAAYVKPTNLLTDKEEQGLLWYLLAEGKGEMPAGFSNEKEKRHTTWSAEHILVSTIKEIYLGWTDGKYVTQEELFASPPLRFTVNEDIFLIGVKYRSDHRGIKINDTYLDDVEVTLKDANGTLIDMAKFNSEVKCVGCYKLTFSHAIELSANVMYELKYSSNVSGVKHRTYDSKIHTKEIYGTNINVKISVLEDTETPIMFLIIAPKV